MPSVAAKFFKCLSEGLRLRIVRLLRDEELNGHELTRILDVPQSTLSRHLAVLKEAGLIESRRQGSWSFFKLKGADSLNGRGRELLDLVQELMEDDGVGARDVDGLREVLEDRRRAVREHFEASGASWEAFQARNADPDAKLAALARLVPRELVVADVGCGSGWLLPELGAARARIIAVDNAPRQLASARARAADLGLEDVEFREGDLADLPMRDQEADAVFLHLALHHAAQPEAALREARRVLKDGGSLVVTDFLPHQEGWLRDEHADLWPGFDPAEVEALLASAGFEDIRRETRSYFRDGIRDKSRPGAGLEIFVISGRVDEARRSDSEES